MNDCTSSCINVQPPFDVQCEGKWPDSPRENRAQVYSPRLAVHRCQNREDYMSAGVTMCVVRVDIFTPCYLVLVFFLSPYPITLLSANTW
jgi:hypothetical protein